MEYHIASPGKIQRISSSYITKLNFTCVYFLLSNFSVECTHNVSNKCIYAIVFILLHLKTRVYISYWKSERAILGEYCSEFLTVWTDSSAHTRNYEGQYSPLRSQGAFTWLIRDFIAWLKLPEYLQEWSCAISRDIAWSKS